MTVYIIYSDDPKTSHLSDVLFPIVTKLETDKTFDYADITRDKNDKPQPIADHYFNISHCDHYWCIVFSDEECGIDIEPATKTINTRLERRILAENERPFDNNLLKTWVLKEAYAKYRGQGIGMGLNSISAHDIIKKYQISDLSTKQCVCFAIQQKPTNLKVVSATWSNNKLLL